MSRRLDRLTVFLLVAATALCLPACHRPFAPQAISADLVPEQIRVSLDRARVSDVIWHVSQADWNDGLSLYAATYTLTAPDGPRYRFAEVVGVQSDPDRRGGAASIGIDAKRVFAGQIGSGSGIVEGADHPYVVAVSISAGGYCFDSRAAHVVAKTTEGREFRCPVTNGFWLIVVNDAKPSPNPVARPVELWAEITARSSSDTVLHRLDLGRPM